MAASSRTIIPPGEIYAFGIHASSDHVRSTTSGVTIRGAQIADNSGPGVMIAGVYVLNSFGSVADSRIRDIRHVHGQHFGDGVSVRTGPGLHESSRGRLELTGSLIERAQRAGVSVCGGDVTISDNRILCSPMAIDGESDFTEGWHAAYRVDDRGGNRCGCGEAVESCETVSNAIVPLAYPEFRVPVLPGRL